MGTLWVVQFWSLSLMNRPKITKKLFSCLYLDMQRRTFWLPTFGHFWPNWLLLGALSNDSPNDTRKPLVQLWRNFLVLKQTTLPGHELDTSVDRATTSSMTWSMFEQPALARPRWQIARLKGLSSLQSVLRSCSKRAREIFSFKICFFNRNIFLHALMMARSLLNWPPGATSGSSLMLNNETVTAPLD